MKIRLLLSLLGVYILTSGACAGWQALRTNDCCQKTLTIDHGHKDYVDIVDMELASYSPPAADSGQAKLLLPSQRDWLIPCDYHRVVIIEKDFSSKQNVFRPAAPALTIDQLEKLGDISLTIAATSYISFDDFLIFLMRNPPDQAGYVLYLGGQEVRAKDGAKDNGLIYCQHDFGLYRLKAAHDQEGLRRFTNK